MINKKTARHLILVSNYWMYLIALEYIRSKSILSKDVLFLVSNKCDFSRLNDRYKKVYFDSRYFPIITKVYLQVRLFLVLLKLGPCNFYIPFYTKHSRAILPILQLNSIRIIEEGELGFSIHLQKDRELDYFPKGYSDIDEFIVTDLDSFPKIDIQKKVILNPLKIDYTYQAFFKAKSSVVLFPAVHRIQLNRIAIYIEKCLHFVKPPVYIKLHPTWFVARSKLDAFSKILDTYRLNIAMCPNSVILELESVEFVDLFGPMSSMERISKKTGHLYTRLTFFDDLY